MSQPQNSDHRIRRNPAEPTAGDPARGGAASAGLYERAIGVMEAVVLITDARQRDNPIVFVNAAMESMTGYSPAEVVGHNWRFLQGPDSDPATIERIGAAVAAGERVTAEILNYRKDGTPFWNHLSITPLRDEAGAVTHFVGLQQDITALKHTESELRSREMHFRRLVKTSPIGIYELDTEGRFIEANFVLAQTAGRTTSAIQGMHFTDAFPPESRSEAQAFFDQAVGGEVGDLEIEAPVLRPDGDRRLVALTLTTIREGERVVGVHGTARDITERRRTEASLRESEQMFRQLSLSVGEIFWIFTPDFGRAIYVSPAFEEIWGLPLERVYEEPRIWLDAVHPEDVPRIRAAISAPPPNDELRLEYRVLRPDGTVRWVHAQGHPIRDAEGHVYRVAGTIRDITEQKTLEAQLRHAQKMEAVGRLAGGVAHDFNNMLTAITGHTQLLLHDVDPSDPIRDSLEEIARAAERSAALTQQLLAFSRKQILQPRRLDLSGAVRGVEGMLRRLIGESIDVRTNLAPNLPTVWADPGQVEQVIMNLVVNARDAMPHGGRLTVTTRQEMVRETRRLDHGDLLLPGRYAVLEVADTGIGMTPEIQARVFEPFFTTKPPGQGTGLGLPTVYGVAKQSGGGVTLRSAPAEGSTFVVYLPLGREASELPSPERPRTAAAAGTETVLLVEDEPAVRMLVSRLLRQFGYTVLEADGGPAALEMLEAHAAPIDLLLTDVVMPGMSGREVADQARRRRPDIRVLYMSGYTDDAIVQHGVLEPGTELIEKPFTPDALAARIRAVLEAGRG